MKKREDRESSDIITKVREAQINQLYKQSWVALVGVLVVAISLCVAFWQVLPSWKLALWLAVLIVVTFARGYLVAAFHRKTPVGSEIEKWAKWHVVGTSASGLMWALPSFFLWPENHPDYYLVWALCILPLGSSTIATYYTWKPSYISFLFLSALPISLRFFFEGGLLYIILGFLTLSFIAVLVQTGSLIHAASVRMLRVSFRNEALSSFLTDEKVTQEELTQQLQKAHDQLQRISLTDELTGLWNRRCLNTTIQKDIAQVFRHYRNIHEGVEKRNTDNTDIVFIMVDLDHFKKVNDTYGHGAGDQVLIQMGRLLTKSTRGMDTTIRWGGEEFLVVSRNTRRDSYTTLVERIRNAVETHQFDIGKESPIHLTCSIGAAIFPFLTNNQKALSWEKVIDLADACLYAAKRSGRNAWVGIISTDFAVSDDLTPNLTKNLPKLITDGKLEMKTNLKEGSLVCWTD